MEKLKTVVLPAKKSTQLRLDAFYDKPVETEPIKVQKNPVN
jgi:hypothetical protein